MPYSVQKRGGGYKVVTSAGPHKGHEHSNKPLTKERAQAQQRALYVHAGEDAVHSPPHVDQMHDNKYRAKYDKE